MITRIRQDDGTLLRFLSEHGISYNKSKWRPVVQGGHVIGVDVPVDGGILFVSAEFINTLNEVVGDLPLA